MKNKTKEELLEIINTSSCDKEKRKAKMHLWHMMQNWSDEKLQQCIEGSKDVEKEIAKWHLWRRNLDTNFNNLLEIVKTSPDEDKVHEAVIIMGEKKYPQAFDCLITLLNETDNDYIREGVAYSLKELGDRRAAPVLFEQLKKHPNCSESLVYALEFFDCRNIFELLIDLFIAEPKAFLLRLNIRDCIKNQDIENVPETIRSNCLFKLDMAIQVANDPENLGQLEDLYEILR